jgi:DNA polymerase III sliding clamp (beta) subunit (PCNA family)
MEISLELFKIQKALKTISTVAKAGSDDITGQVLFEAKEDGKLVLLANNGRLAITVVIEDTEVKKIGRVCVSYFKLFSFLNAFRCWDESQGVDQVKLKLNKSNLTIRLTNILSNGKKASNLLKLRFFPPEKMFLPEPFKTPTFILNAIDLKKAISKVVYAINPNSPRIFIQGMNIKFNKETISFAGTDALKLSEYSLTNTLDNKNELDNKSFLLPYSFIMALRRLLSEELPVFFEINEGFIKVIIGKTTLHGNLIIGDTFPEYEPSFDQYKNSITIDKDILLSSFMPYLSILSEDDYKRITLSINNDELKVFSDYSETTYEGAVGFGDSFIIDINGTYLAQTLEVIDDEKINMKFSDETGLLILEAATSQNQRALLTPINRR